MAYVALDLLKAHAAIIGDADDALLAQCLDAAEAHAAAFMNRRAIIDNPDPPWVLPTDPPPPVPDPDPVPPSVVQGILMYAADFYENRTAGIVGTIYTANPAANALLHFYRVGLGV